MIILQMSDTNPLVRETIMTVLEGPSIATVTTIPATDFCLLDFQFPLLIKSHKSKEL